jgi:type IV secretion system protein VirB5
MGLFGKKTAQQDASSIAQAGHTGGSHSGDGSWSEAGEPSLPGDPKGSRTKGGRGKARKGVDLPAYVLEGREETLGFYSHLAKGKRNWQIIAFLLGVTVLVLVFSLVGMATSSRYIPYVVEQDDMGGARYIGPIEELREPDNAVKAAIVTRWVRDVRTIYSDPAARQDMLYSAYAHVANDASQKLKTYYSDPETDPGRLSQLNISRTVEIEVVIPVPKASGSGTVKEDTYRVQWKERTMKSMNGLPEVQRYEGYFSVVTIPPQSEAKAMQNPYGLYITNYSWSAISDRD